MILRMRNRPVTYLQLTAAVFGALAAAILIIGPQLSSDHASIFVAAVCAIGGAVIVSVAAYLLFRGKGAWFNEVSQPVASWIINSIAAALLVPAFGFVL